MPEGVERQHLTLRGRHFRWGTRTYIMGVLNVTPDSFSDGGDFIAPQAALAQAQQLEAAGADFIDLGGESTRPGAPPVTATTERDRVLPVLQAVRAAVSAPISIDTRRAATARAAVAAGADLVNDVSGGRFDADMLPTVAQLGVPIVLTHSRGTPETMQQLTDYADPVGEIYRELQACLERATRAGVPHSHLIADPGIGFAKDDGQNLALLRHANAFGALGVPLLVGASRKGFIGRLLDRGDPKARDWGTAAACCAAIAGSADILRVHEVASLRDVCRVADAIWRAGE